MAYQYQLLDVAVHGRVATVIINNPPINIITPALYQELATLVAELQNDDDLTVVVFKSADADFFIAHYDVSNILEFPTDGEAERSLELNDFHIMCERVRTYEQGDHCANRRPSWRRWQRICRQHGHALWRCW
jgi:enoyl-CoA hydratase/carnithine racemase